MSGAGLRAIGVAVGLLMTASAAAAGSAPWPDNFTGRLEALALIESLNADLLSHDSATLTLERWCADHRLAEPARIVAERVRDTMKPASPEVRAALDVKPDEKLGYRRVRLKCGDHVLSEADNWYVPARLTPEMNHALETTDTPFGKAVAALHFRRHTLSADLLWRPLPQGLGDERRARVRRQGRARDSRPSARASGGAVDAGWRAVQRGGGDLHRRGAGLPAAKMSADGAQAYCSSLTFSIQLVGASFMATWVMAAVGEAPCQCFSPGEIRTTSPGLISSIGPPSL